MACCVMAIARVQRRVLVGGLMQDGGRCGHVRTTRVRWGVATLTLRVDVIGCFAGFFLADKINQLVLSLCCTICEIQSFGWKSAFEPASELMRCRAVPGHWI